MKNVIFSVLILLAPLAHAVFADHNIHFISGFDLYSKVSALFPEAHTLLMEQSQSTAKLGYFSAPEAYRACVFGGPNNYSLDASLGFMNPATGEADVKDPSMGYVQDAKACATAFIAAQTEAYNSSSVVALQIISRLWITPFPLPPAQAGNQVGGPSLQSVYLSRSWGEISPALQKTHVRELILQFLGADETLLEYKILPSVDVLVSGLQALPSSADKLNVADQKIIIYLMQRDEFLSY